MTQRNIVTLLATTTLIALATGCATQQPGAVASLAESDASRPPIDSQLKGSWRGWFVGGGSDGHIDGEITLLIKDDATYKMISKRRGRGDVTGVSNESGVVVANGRTVTLKSSSGQWTSLVHKGDTLYGVTKASSGHTIQISVERTSDVPVEAP